jgi:hypothetical protein
MEKQPFLWPVEGEEVKGILGTMRSRRKGLVGGRGGEENLACMERKVN